MATYGGVSKLFIIYIRFYLFFCFTDELRGTKYEHFDVATYGGRIHFYIFVAYGYLDNVSSLDYGYQARVSVKRGYVCFCLFITYKSIFLNQYILDRNPRLSSYTILWGTHR